MNFSERLNKVIPGGAHTYSRGDDQFPSNAPQILERAKGVYVYDPSGKRFLDYGMALRAVGIGYAQPEVNEAAIREIEKGNNLTRASTVELEAAELLCNTIPNADMVKFGKNGSTVVSAAVKLSRAYTGRKLIARCAQHPFFSYDDWFIGSTVMTYGVPEEISSLTLRFEYNNLQSLEQLFLNHPNQIACVVLEPTTGQIPASDYFGKLKELCHKNGAVFILDEMITGFRYDIAGAQKYFNVDADLITFGKAMANGFSVAALVGKKEIMDLGGIKKEGARRLFLISSTHGAEMSGMGALIKTIEIYRRDRVTDHLWTYGKKLIDGANEIASKMGLQDFFSFSGMSCSPVYQTMNASGTNDMKFRALFNQEMIKNNVLMPWVSIAFEHGDEELRMTLEAIRNSLEVYQKALNEGIERYLVGPELKPVFREFN